MGAAAVPLIISAIGTGASVYNTQQTAKKQDNALAGQIRQQGNRQREADAKVNEAINKRETSTPDDERAGALGTFLKHIQATGGNATSGLNQGGATSDAYKQQSQDAASGVGDYGTKIADMMSRIDAPMLQRQNEATDQARADQGIDLVRRMAGGDNFLAQMRLQGIRRNPWIDAVSSMANGAASAYGSGSGGGGGGGGSGNSPVGPYASGYRYVKG